MVSCYDVGEDGMAVETHPDWVSINAPGDAELQVGLFWQL